MFALMEYWLLYYTWCFLLFFQLVSVPEVRCFQTVCPPVPPPVHLPKPLDLLQPLASAGRNVWGAVSVLQASTFIRDSVWKEMIVRVSIADAPTSQGTGYSRDAILGEGRMCVFVLFSVSPLLLLSLWHLQFCCQCVQIRPVAVYWGEVFSTVQPYGGTTGDHLWQKEVFTTRRRLSLHCCGGETHKVTV